MYILTKSCFPTETEGIRRRGKPNIFFVNLSLFDVALSV